MPSHTEEERSMHDCWRRWLMSALFWIVFMAIMASCAIAGILVAGNAIR